MALVVTNAATLEMAKYYLNASQPQNLVLRLFTNNITPSPDSTASDFVEARSGGYSPIPLSGAQWTVKPGPPVEASFSQQAFTCNGSGIVQSCYGYFVTREQSGQVAHAERFPNAPYAFANDGDQIKITPRITFQQET
jgi:hypothetical protein